MILRIKVKEWFTEAVKMNFDADPLLRETLLRGHPNVEGFLGRITFQLAKSERQCSQKGTKLTEENKKWCVTDMTKLFMKGMEGEAKRRYENDQAKIQRQKEADQLKEFESVLAGKPEGEFAEAGVITNEEIDKRQEKIFTEKEVK